MNRHWLENLEEFFCQTRELCKKLLRLSRWWAILTAASLGWLIAPRESADLAQQLIADTVSRHDVMPGALTLHADRGTFMRSTPVDSLLVDLDVAKSHSRPYTSDDNP